MQIVNKFSNLVASIISYHLQITQLCGLFKKLWNFDYQLKDQNELKSEREIFLLTTLRFIRRP